MYREEKELLLHKVNLNGLGDCFSNEQTPDLSLQNGGNIRKLMAFGEFVLSAQAFPDEQ